MGTTGYKIMLLLHVLSAVVAFGPLFLYPPLRRAGATAEIAKLHLYMVVPALVAMWVFGMGLVGMSDEAIQMSDGWIGGALLVWVISLAISVGLIRPALTDDSEGATAKLSAGVGVTHLMLVVGLFLMVFQPGA
ncbi:MAG: hypothetical protein R2754_15015 [Microthrixaceae bacterium]